MQTMKFRKSRIIILVVFLILVSAVGYWLMYVTSRPRSGVSEFHSHVDTFNVRHRHSQKHVAAGGLSERRHHVKDNDYIDSYRSSDRSSIQRKDAVDAPVASKRLNAERQRAKLNEDDRYDESDEDEMIDDLKPPRSDDAAVDAQHDRDHPRQRGDEERSIRDQPGERGDDEQPFQDYAGERRDQPGERGDSEVQPIRDQPGELGDDEVQPIRDQPAERGDEEVQPIRDQPGERKEAEQPIADGDDEFDDAYDDGGRRVKNLRSQNDAQRPAKNTKRVSGVNHDDETVNELPSDVDRNRDNIDNVGDNYGVRKHRADEADERASVVDLRHEQDGSAKQRGSWREDRELREVELEGLRAPPKKPVRVEKDDERAEAWRLQQLHDGVQASHVRSHNIAPVPRVYVSSPVNQVDRQKLPETTRTSGIDDVLDNMDVESPRRSAAEDGSHYFIIHSGRASRVNDAIHPNLHTLPDHVEPQAYIFTSSSLPNEQRQRPSVGNGYLATVVHGADMFVSGVYNGEGSESHRAAVPSTCSFVITGTEPPSVFNRTYELNVGAGIYSERSVGPSYVITQRLYVHRALKSLVVVEVDLERSDLTEPLQLNVELNRWTASYDFTFVTQDSGREQVSYKVGTLKATETRAMDAADKRLHVLYDQVPHKLVPMRTARRTKWIFISAVGLSKQQVEQFYEEGKRRVHSNDELFASHVRAWSSLWSRGRVDVDGDLSMARAAYASWYYILSSLPVNHQPQFVGLSPSGLPLSDSREFSGRVMYHQELWLFPSLLLFHSDLSRHIITSRLRMVRAARRNAAAVHRPGLLFPWQSGATGVELSDRSDRGVVSPFVSAGFVWSVLQSVYASNRSSDVTNTSLGGAVNDVCHFLLSKVSPVPKSHEYGIFDVISLDESQGFVNNSPFVNAIVKQALLTPAFIYSLENKTTTDFRYFANSVDVAVEDNIYHPAYDGVGLRSRVSQPDAVLLGYPLQMTMPREIRLNDLRHYDVFLDDSSSAMSWAMQTIGWAEVRELTKANQHLHKQLSFIKNSFQVWANSSVNTASDVAYNFLPAMSTYLQSLVNGFAGVRLRPDRLDIHPVLPSGVNSLHLVGLDYLGAQLNVVVTMDEVIIVQKSPRSITELRVTVFDPEEIHLLQPRREVRFQRRRAAVTSSTAPLPA